MLFRDALELLSTAATRKSLKYKLNYPQLRQRVSVHKIYKLLLLRHRASVREGDKLALLRTRAYVQDDSTLDLPK